eukprot:COSAG01_NODE_47393_length_390_cov_3.982818_1_plen_34_part_10
MAALSPDGGGSSLNGKNHIVSPEGEPDRQVWGAR